MNKECPTNTVLTSTSRRGVIRRTLRRACRAWRSGGNKDFDERGGPPPSCHYRTQKSSPVQGKMVSSVYLLAGVIKEKKEKEANRLPDHNASEV